VVLVVLVRFMTVLVTVTTGLIAGLLVLHRSSSSSSSSGSNMELHVHHESRIKITATDIQPTPYREYGQHDDKWQSDQECITYTGGADKSLAQPGRKHADVSVRIVLISFGALPCRKKNLMTARVSMLLKSRASLTCFRVCFLPGRAKDLSAPQY